MNSPQSGKPVAGTGGLRKIRFSLRTVNRGKSDSARVCHVYFQCMSAIYLSTIHTKTR